MLIKAPPIFDAVALYDYDPATDEEIAIREGDFIRVYDQSDPDWWFVKQDDNVGLVPATYVEIQGGQAAAPPVAQVTAPKDQDATLQKAQLLSALGGLGFAPQQKQKEATGQIYGPDDIKYYPVTVIGFDIGNR